VTTDTRTIPPALAATGVRRWLRLGRERIDVLRGVSFTVEPGEFVALIGPSGSGKSTLLGVIGGLDRPDDGQVVVAGLDITRMSEAELARVRNTRIGMVFQSYNLIPTLTAQENVELPLYVGSGPGSPARRSAALLEQVGLGHRRRHRPNQLSGGEQQRVAIARAMAAEPTVVIADEPTGNLDRASGERLLDLVAAIRRERGTTFLVATHDRDVAARADRQLRLEDGMLVTGDGRGTAE
jgi:putative ABC transport system ATP-binding protein